MKKSFTLIELLVTMTIVGVLFSIAVPAYDRHILKAQFDNEAVVTLKAYMLAQEQYFIETGHYYTDTAEDIFNEDMISSELKIDLKKSRNFLYVVVKTTNDTSYRVKAILRADAWNTLCAVNDKTNMCKQNGTFGIYDWPKAYDRSISHHYLEASYPVEIANSINGISYANIYTGM